MASLSENQKKLIDQLVRLQVELDSDFEVMLTVMRLGDGRVLLGSAIRGEEPNPADTGKVQQLLVDALARLAENPQGEDEPLEREHRDTTRRYRFAPSFYVRGPGGYGPLNYFDEATGVLVKVIRQFLAGADDPGTIDVMRDWIDYYVNAPCWQEEERLTGVREMIRFASNRDAIEIVLKSCLDIGLDPL